MLLKEPTNATDVVGVTLKALREACECVVEAVSLHIATSLSPHLPRAANPS